MGVRGYGEGVMVILRECIGIMRGCIGRLRGVLGYREGVMLRGYNEGRMLMFLPRTH